MYGVGWCTTSSRNSDYLEVLTELYQLRNGVHKITSMYINSEIVTQRLGRVSNHLEITFRDINSEIWCTMFVNFLIKKMHNLVEEKDAQCVWIWWWSMYPSISTEMYYERSQVMNKYVLVVSREQRSVYTMSFIAYSKRVRVDEP